MIIKLPSGLNKRLSNIAKKLNKSKSACIIEAIEQYLEKYHEKITGTNNE